MFTRLLKSATLALVLVVVDTIVVSAQTGPDVANTISEFAAAFTASAQTTSDLARQLATVLNTLNFPLGGQVTIEQLAANAAETTAKMNEVNAQLQQLQETISSSETDTSNAASILGGRKLRSSTTN